MAQARDKKGQFASGTGGGGSSSSTRSDPFSKENVAKAKRRAVARELNRKNKLEQIKRRRVAKLMSQF